MMMADGNRNPNLRMRRRLYQVLDLFGVGMEYIVRKDGKGWIGSGE